MNFNGALEPRDRFYKHSISVEKTALTAVEQLQYRKFSCTADGNVAIRVTPIYRMALGMNFTTWVCRNEFIKGGNAHGLG